MRRKVVLHGPSTLTISLPTKWIKKQGINKGDELEVNENNNVLTISPTKHTAPSKSISINVSDLSEGSIKSILGVLHKSGYDEIDVNYDNEKILDILQSRITSMLIGYEIISHFKNSAKIKCISSQDEQEFNNVMRRTFLVAISMSKLGLEILSKKDFSKIEEIKSLELTNNRLTNFCHRIINKRSSYLDKSTYHYTILWIIECICDDYKNIFNYIQAKKIESISKEVISSYESVNKLFEDYYSLFYKFSPNKLDSLRRSQSEIEENLQNKITTHSNSESIIFVYLHNIAQKISDALGSTTGIYY